MQHVKPTCAAALAALLMSAGPAAAPAAAETAAADAVEQVAGDAAEKAEKMMDGASKAAADGHDHVADHDHAHPHAEGEGEGAPSDGFATEVERVSYALGVNIGQSFNTPGFEVELDTAVLSEALEAAYTGGELRISTEQSMAVLRDFQESMIERQEAQATEAGAENRAAGAAFLEENGAREGVVTTASGLQYEIIEQGEGATAGPDDTVQLHYTGTLINGDTFDSSAQRGPASFPVTGVIPGFSEGLQLLPVGTKAKLFIPSELAYGDSPQGPGGPGSVLTFDVEILGIESAPAELSLAEQIEQAQAQMEDDLEMVKADAEQHIADLKAQLEASGGSAETVGGGAAAQPKKEPMYD